MINKQSKIEKLITELCPNGVVFKELGNVCKIETGKLNANEAVDDGKYMFFTTAKEPSKIDRYRWDTEALLIAGNANVGEVKHYIGKFEAYQRTYVLDKFQENIKYIYYYLLGNLKGILVRSKSGSTMPYIRKGDLEKFNILVPESKNIQQKIVYVLDSIQDAIRTQENIIEKTKELNKSMMADLFKYGGPSFRKGRKLKKTEIGEIPENWEVVTIKNIGEVVTGTTPSTLVKDYWNGDIPFVTPTDITKKYVENTERYISQKGLQKARLLPKDSILVTCIASIGKISITPKPCISNQQINAIICKENIDNEYIYYVMNHMSDRLKMWAGQTTSPIVKKSLFEKFILPLPKDKNEQREIAEILQTIDQKIEIEQKKKALYEELFRTMLNKLMTGEIRVDNLKL